LSAELHNETEPESTLHQTEGQDGEGVNYAE